MFAEGSKKKKKKEVYFLEVIRLILKFAEKKYILFLCEISQSARQDWLVAANIANKV